MFFSVADVLNKCGLTLTAKGWTGLGIYPMICVRAVRTIRSRPLPEHLEASGVPWLVSGRLPPACFLPPRVITPTPAVLTPITS